MPRHAYILLMVLCMTCRTEMRAWGQTRKDSTEKQRQRPDSAPNKVIRGHVIDAETGAALSYATVYISGSQVGTTSDAEGFFVLYPEKWRSDTIVFQALGYEKASRVLSRGLVDTDLSVYLHREARVISEFTINASGVDPAVLLVKRVIAHKQENDPDKLDNYSFRAYNRLEIDIKNISDQQLNGYPVLKNYGFLTNNLDSNNNNETFLPAYLTENLSDYYYRNQPRKEREVTLGSMAKGVKNADLSRYLGTSYLGIDIYKNGIPVADKKFVSPISDRALLFYRYSIRDTEMIHGQRIIRLDYAPRNEGDLCFAGSIRIVDSTYAVEQILMQVPKSVNFNWADRIEVYQHFTFTHDRWFTDHEYFELSVSAYGSKSIPGLIARKTTDYHDIKFNSAVTDSMLDDAGLRDAVTTSDSSRSRADSWWRANRPDSLSKREVIIQHTADTILSLPITRRYINVVTFLVSGVQDVGPIELGPYWYLYSNDPVEGDRYRFTIGTPRTLKDLHIAVYGAYGTLDKRYKYGGEGKWVINRKPWTFIDVLYIHDVGTGTDHPEYVESGNLFASLVRKPGIPWKQAFLDKVQAELYKQLYNGFSGSVQLQHKVFTPYAPLPSAGIFKDENGNPAGSVNSFSAAAEIRYAYREKYIEGKYNRTYIGTKYPIFDFIYTVGIKHVMNSAYDFKKVNFSVKESINIPGLGGISYTLYGGKYFGVLPYSLLEVHPGNEYLIYGPNLYEMMNAYEFISDQFLGLKVEHDLGGGIFNYVPLLKKLKLRQFWTAKGLIGSLSQANSELNQYHGYEFKSLAGNPYIELGTGIANILRVARIDFVWRVAPAAQPNENLSKHFGIFGSAQLQF